jgi:putative transposase
VALLCETFKITRQALYRHLARRKAVKATPANPGCCIKGTPTPELTEAIRELSKLHPGWGTRKIWAHLTKIRHLKAGLNRVYALMKKCGLLLQSSGKLRVIPLFGRVCVEESNRRWATDFTRVWTTLDGWVAVIPVIDCGDRFLLGLEASKSEDSLHILSPVRGALSDAFGKPEAVPVNLELRTDHGSVYTGRDCEALCEYWKVEHSFAPVGRPTGNAVAERVILTLKTELTWTRDWESLEELRLELARWRQVYNEERPHQALGWLTPAQKRFGTGLDCRAKAAVQEGRAA